MDLDIEVDVVRESESALHKHLEGKRKIELRLKIC